MPDGPCLKRATTFYAPHLLLQIRIEVLNGGWRATLPALACRTKPTPQKTAA